MPTSRATQSSLSPVATTEVFSTDAIRPKFAVNRLCVVGDVPYVAMGQELVRVELGGSSHPAFHLPFFPDKMTACSGQLVVATHEGAFVLLDPDQPHESPSSIHRCGDGDKVRSVCGGEHHFAFGFWRGAASVRDPSGAEVASVGPEDAGFDPGIDTRELFGRAVALHQGRLAVASKRRVSVFEVTGSARKEVRVERHSGFAGDVGGLALSAEYLAAGDPAHRNRAGQVCVWTNGADGYPVRSHMEAPKGKPGLGFGETVCFAGGHLWVVAEGGSTSGRRKVYAFVVGEDATWRLAYQSKFFVGAYALSDQVFVYNDEKRRELHIHRLK